MTIPEIAALARQAAARHEADPTMSTEDCIAAAIVEAISKDREADDRLQDPRLFLPVDFVRGQFAAVDAALNMDLYPGQSREMVARRLYAERDDAVRRLARYIQEMPERVVQAAKASARNGAIEP